MQQKRSVTFEDWKEAYKMGFDGFILGCGEKTAQGYIDKFSEMGEVKGMPVFRSDGVHVVFKREPTRIPADVMGVKPPLSKTLITGFVAGFILTFLVTYVVFSLENKPVAPVIEVSKTVTVQDHIIPRECFITYTQTETGWYINIMDMNSDHAFYIEVDDYKEFLKEYREQ